MVNKVIAGISAVIILAFVAVAAYYATLPSAPPLPEAPQHLEIPSCGSYMMQTNDIEFFVVGGVVQNNLTTNVDSVNITVTFFDVENETIGTRLSHPVLDIIKPEESAPFEVYLLLSNNINAPDSYELMALGLPTDEEPFLGVEIMNETITEGYNSTTGYHSISGEVSNSKNRKAFSVSVVCAYYDSGGDVLAVPRAYVSSELEARATAPFEISSRPHSINPAGYELYVSVHHYEMLIFSNYVLLIFLILIFVLFVVYMKRRGW